MLEDLGVDGMSSDEEVKTLEGKKFFILIPKWRAPMLTPWIRVFDSLYLRHRNQQVNGDQRGCMPHKRHTCSKLSTSRTFVPGLPINAYRSNWLEQQPDVANVVHPSPHKTYTHDPQLAQCVLVPPTTFTHKSHVFFEDWPYFGMNNHTSPPVYATCWGREVMVRKPGAADGYSACTYLIHFTCTSLII